VERLLTFRDADPVKISTLIDLPPETDAMTGLEAIAERDPVVWCMINRRVKGDPLIFDNTRALTDESLGELRRTLVADSDYDTEVLGRLQRHRPWQRQPMRDLHRHKVYEKSRQVGVTEVSENEVFHFLAHHPGTKWITCVPDDAEILTRRGWKLYTELIPNDQALVLDGERHVTRWEPILEVRSYDYRGFLSSVGPYPFHCTANHRWPVVEKTTAGGKRAFKRKIVEAWHLKQHHTLVRMAPHDQPRSPQRRRDRLLSTRHAALLGWVVTDGHQWLTGSARVKNTVMVEVSQNERKYLREIEELAGKKAQPAHAHTTAPTIAIGDHGGRIVGVRNPKAKRKRDRFLYGGQYRVRLAREDVNAILHSGYRSKDDLPGLVTRLSPEAAKAMWDAMIKTEGNRSGKMGRSLHFTQLPGPVLDAFQILCTLTGRAANLNARGCYVIDKDSRSAKMRAVYEDSEERDRYYMGKVWCPRTPSGTWCMRYRGRVVFTGNTFPREKQLTDFSNTRVAAAFADTPRMAALVGTPNQVFTRRVGDSYWLFRSAWESNLGEGEPADGVTLDEKDRMRDKIEFAFKEALKSSKWGFFREISTPTLPRQGIDLPFSKSDQQTWLVRCKRCGERQPIDHKENIVQVKSFPIGCQELPPGAFEFQCRKQKCRGELDRVYSGEWVPKYPDRKHIRGYAISQLMAAWISATQVMQDKIDMRFPEIWLNYVVGVPAGSDMEMLSDADFERSCAGHQLYTSRTSAWSHVTFGADWGNLNWVLVLGRNKHNQRLYVIGVDVFEDTQVELESAKRVLNYVRQFSPDMGAADAGYGKDRNALLLRELCPNGDEGKFWVQQYDQNPKTSKTFVPEWSDPSRARVTVSRLIQLKNACRVIKEREIGFPNLEIPIVDALKRHLKSLVPFREIDDETKQVVETIKTSGEDHLAHAFGSALLCMERLSKQSRFNFSFE
jgi:phage terminase large subunit GpA